MFQRQAADDAGAERAVTDHESVMPVARGRGAKREYARGHNAIAECQRSGQKMMYRDLLEDGHIEGLLVHPDWWEPKHPQEIPVEVTDPIALYRPSPEISIEENYGLPENLDGGTTPTTSFNTAQGILAVTLNPGDTSLALVNAVHLEPWNDWVFIPQDGGGNYVSRMVEGFASNSGNTTVFHIPFTTAFPVGQLATAGAAITLGLGTP